MPTVVRPQTIQTGSRFPAWDKDNSLCFEIAFRRRAAAGDFEPCWNRHTYSKSNYDWSCAEPAHGSGFCTFSASLSTNPVTGEAFVRSVCLKHAHPQCGTSRALREDLRKELEAACDELEGAAKAEFVRLRRGTRGSTSARDEGIAPHVAQQLVVWDVWIAAGKDRARQFEQALLAGGQAAEGYPTGGVFGDTDDNLVPADPLDHPLANISPLTKPPPAPSTSPRRVVATAATSSSSSNSARGGNRAASMKRIVENLEAKHRPDKRAVGLELILPKSPVKLPNKRRKLDRDGSATQRSSKAPEGDKTSLTPIQSSSSRLPASRKSPPTSSSRSSRTREGAPTPTPPEKAVKREISPELGLAAEQKDATKPVTVPLSPPPPDANAAQTNASPTTSPTFVEYLAKLDPSGGFDYSSFAPRLEHLGIKNPRALERWAESDEKLKPPQRIQVGSRFPAWDTQESCFELTFRKEAARRDFVPSWDDTNYNPSTHTFWGCAHTTRGRCTCSVKVLLSKDVDKQSPFVSYAYFGHNHPSSGLSDDARFASSEDLAGVRKELRTGAFREFARLKKVADMVQTEEEMASASCQQQLVMWDVWVAIGFKRARQFEKKLLEDGMVIDGYPATGILDDALSPDSDPLAHPLAFLSPLTQAVLDAALAGGAKRAQSKGRMQANDRKGGRRKTSEVKTGTDAGATTKARDESSRDQPNKRAVVAAKLVSNGPHNTASQPAASPSQSDRTIPKTEHSSALSAHSPSPSDRLSSNSGRVSKRSSLSTDSWARKKPKLEVASPTVESKQKVKKEDELQVLSFTMRPSSAPSASHSALDPAFLAYLSTLDTRGAMDYSIFAADLAHLGIKNHKALKRVAATGENRKRLVKDLTKLRSTDKYALIMFEEDLRDAVGG